MGRGLAIDGSLSARQLRDLAFRERSVRTAKRMLAIANALDGMSRADAAAAAGMERQALRDAVIRYNAEGLAGLVDRPGSGRRPALTEGELAVLSERIFKGPDPKGDGVSAWTLRDLAAFVAERFGKMITPQSLSRMLRREGFSRQKARPIHPKTSPRARDEFEKRGSRRP